MCRVHPAVVDAAAAAASATKFERCAPPKPPLARVCSPLAACLAGRVHASSIDCATICRAACPAARAALREQHLRWSPQTLRPAG
mmetsp:Transcript_22803/g.51625  ORF Transcript_22803/g.51625 Transcript_22803/m.51625 type:complete len:85 (-) Transcript_22803:362-616(-)